MTPALQETDTIEFLLALARTLHRYGTPAHRLEEGIMKSCELLGLEAEVFTTPTMIIMSFGKHGALRTRMMRVEGGELDMGKLADTDQVADEVAARVLTPTEGLARLHQIVEAPPQYGHASSTIAYGVTASALAGFFDGSVEDVVVAGTIGLVLGVLAQVVKRSTAQARVFELVGAALAAFIAHASSAWWPGVTPSLVMVSALIVLLPGMQLTVAMTELATRNPMAGTARLMTAVIVLLQLVIGVALGEFAAGELVDIQRAPIAPLPVWAQWISLGVASIGMTVVVQAHARALGWILVACAVGYAGAQLGTLWLGNQLGVIVGSFALGVLSNIYARRLRRPALVVQVPAVLLLVPGGTGFVGMRSLLSHNTVTGLETLFAMFVLALSIVAGLLIANALVSPRRSL